MQSVAGTIFHVQDVRYVIENGEVKVERYEGTDSLLEIPEVVNNGYKSYKVTGIGIVAFKDCTVLSSITLPNTIKDIGPAAFENCTNLISFEMPNSVTTLGNYVFEGCTKLESVSVSNNVKVIPNGIFSGCSSLKSVHIPQGVEELGYGLFTDCSSLSTITLPSSIIKLDSSVFYNCTSLVSVNLPGRITSLGDYVFWGCKNLSSIVIPNSVKTVGKSLFHGCTRLETVTLSARLTSMGNNMFWGCENLSNITIPESVTAIGDYAFFNCSKISSLTIPAGVTDIGANVFDRCTGLKSLIIPESVTRIGSKAFYNCTLNNLEFLGTPTFASNTFNGLDKSSVILCQSQSYETIKKQFAGLVYSIDSPVDFTKVVPYLAGVDVSFSKNPYFKGAYSDFDIKVYDNEEVVYTSNLKEKAYGAFITGLIPENGYTLVLEDKQTSEGYNSTDFTTKKPEISVETTATQSTLKIRVIASSDRSISPTDLKVRYNNAYINCDKEGVALIKNLSPEGTKFFNACATYNGKTYENYFTYKTANLIKTAKAVEITPTTAILSGELIEGDAVIEGVGFENVGEGYTYQVAGLNPNTTYTYTFYAVANGGNKVRRNFSFKTTAVNLSMLDPRCVSEKCAIVAAETNLSDLETRAGFQWKKYDAPAELKPSEAYAAIYGGQLEGYIKNLQPTYYKVRAFFEDANGSRTFSSWVMFDPTDFSYFEPTVHTYPVQGVTNNEATVRGYALAGTDPIISQGFQYWKAPGAAESRMKAPSADKIYTVQANGQIMTATLTDLEPGTEYVLRSYVETAAGYTYGEEQSFTTGGSAGIGDIEADETEAEIVGYYDLTGRRYDAPQQGFNIIVYSDGTSRKYFVR